MIYPVLFRWQKSLKEERVIALFSLFVDEVASTASTSGFFLVMNISGKQLVSLLHFNESESGKTTSNQGHKTSSFIGLTQSIYLENHCKTEKKKISLQSQCSAFLTCTKFCQKKS
jgi:hypothetical protein